MLITFIFFSLPVERLEALVNPQHISADERSLFWLCIYGYAKAFRKRSGGDVVAVYIGI